MNKYEKIEDGVYKFIIPPNVTEEERESHPAATQTIEQHIKCGVSVEIKNAIIEGDLILVSVVVKNRINIQNSEIRGVVKASYADFKDLVKFKNSKFKSEVVFHSATFEKDLILDSVIFEGGKLDFAGSQVWGITDFRKSVFKQDVDFDGLKVKGNAFFCKADFQQKASFIGARVEGKASFCLAHFEKEVSFSFCKFQTDSDFTRATFMRKFNMQGASTSSCPFTQCGTQYGLNATIDLRGCTYDLIDNKVKWKELMKSRLDPEDNTQPYTQLEQTFRKAGQDQLANKVYYERRCRESSSIRLLRHPQHRLAWPLDKFLKVATGYGVKLWRLLPFIILAVLVGAFVFHTPGAVVVQKDTQTGIPQGHCREEAGVSSLNYQESFWFSLRIFLPVEIPSGSEWKASSRTLCWKLTYSGFASILKLIGWIFVPVGVAGLAGWLKR